MDQDPITTQMQLLQFEPLNSAVEGTFWHSFSQRKIDVYKLDDTAIDVYGYYQSGQSYASQPTSSHIVEAAPAKMCLGTGAFDGTYVSHEICGIKQHYLELTLTHPV